MDMYYEEMGWDKETGPCRSTYQRLGLAKVQKSWVRKGY